MRKSRWFQPHFGLKNQQESKGSPSKESNTTKAMSHQSVPNPYMGKSIPHKNLIQLLAPETVTDLAIHTKKIAEVEDWLISNVLTSNKSAILVLTGPTGSGKTETLKRLCKSFNIEITEWTNPLDTDKDDLQGNSQTTKFSIFLSEAVRYSSLFDTNLKKLILIEEFPNSIIHNPNELEPILMRVKDKGKFPIVFICTDNKDYHTNLVKKIFTSSLSQSLNIIHISFNSISITLLKSALKRSINIIQNKYGDMYQIPSQQSIEAIAQSCNGDIRCAINNLEFACLKGSKVLPTTIKNSQENDEESQASTSAKRKRKTKVKDATIVNMTKDTAVGLFHGIGRVLYPKRLQNGKEWKFEHEPESIYDEFITQPSTFVNFLFENYINFFSNFRDICQGAEILSVSELLLSNWKDDDLFAKYGLWYAIAGLMITNEKSVSKWNSVKGPTYIDKQKVDASNFEQRILMTLEKTYYNVIINNCERRS